MCACVRVCVHVVRVMCVSVMRVSVMRVCMHMLSLNNMHLYALLAKYATVPESENTLEHNQIQSDCNSQK